jgi:hypothetical protein
MTFSNIAFGIVQIIAPITYLAVLILAAYLTFCGGLQNLKVTNVAAFLGGLVLCGIVILIQGTTQISFEPVDLIAIQVSQVALAVPTGIVLGFLFLVLAERLIGSSENIFILFSSALSSISLYFYLILTLTKPVFSVGSASFLFGCLFYLATLRDRTGQLWKSITDCSGRSLGSGFGRR